VTYGTEEWIVRTWHIFHQRPKSCSPIVHEIGHQVYLQTCVIIASKCITNLGRSWPPSVSLTWVHHGLQVSLQPGSYTTTNCIPILSRSLSGITSPRSLDHVHLEYLHTRSITASKSISEHSPDHGLQVPLFVHLALNIRHTSPCSQTPPAASPNIHCVDG
jgi:hypothetical protein